MEKVRYGGKGKIPSIVYGQPELQSYLRSTNKGGWIFHPTRTEKLDMMLLMAYASEEWDKGSRLTPKELALFLTSPSGRYALTDLSYFPMLRDNNETVIPFLIQRLKEFKDVIIKIQDFKR